MTIYMWPHIYSIYCINDPNKIYNGYPNNIYIFFTTCTSVQGNLFKNVEI